MLELETKDLLINFADGKYCSFYNFGSSVIIMFIAIVFVS